MWSANSRKGSGDYAHRTRTDGSDDLFPGRSMCRYDNCHASADADSQRRSTQHIRRGANTFD